MARTEKQVEAFDEETALATRSEADDFNPLELMNKELMQRAERAMKAKDDDWKSGDADFWKPTKVGDELKGIYIASRQGARYMVHFIGLVNAKGKPYAVRLNGTTILTRELRKFEAGTPIRITYKGEGKTDAGNKLGLYEVKHLET